MKKQLLLVVALLFMASTTFANEKPVSNATKTEKVSLADDKHLPDGKNENANATTTENTTKPLEGGYGQCCRNASSEAWIGTSHIVVTERACANNCAIAVILATNYASAKIDNIIRCLTEK